VNAVIILLSESFLREKKYKDEGCEFVNVHMQGETIEGRGSYKIAEKNIFRF
jgi:hypothetical protein